MILFYKKIYITIAVFVALSGSVLAWILLYGDFLHNSPIRAKQVFNSSAIRYVLLEDSKNFSKYNVINNVQTIGEATSFNRGGNEYGCKSD